MARHPAPRPHAADHNALDIEIERARAATAAAEQTVTEASRARLAELLRRSEKERWDALTDADLTPSDRIVLRRSLQADQKRAMTERRRRFLIRSWLHFVFPLGRRRFVALLILTGLALPLAIAWRNSGILVVVTKPTSVTVAPFEGEPFQSLLEPHRELIIREIKGPAVEARWWKSGRGYDRAYVPKASIERIVTSSDQQQYK